MSRSREIRGYLVFSNRSEIWQAPRQQRFKHILFTIGEQSIYLATGRFGRFEVLRVSVAVPVGGPQPIPRVHQRETYTCWFCVGVVTGDRPLHNTDYMDAPWCPRSPVWAMPEMQTWPSDKDTFGDICGPQSKTPSLHLKYKYGCLTSSWE